MSWSEVMEKSCGRVKQRLFPLTILCIVVTAFLIPVLLDWCVFANNIPSHLTNGEWAGFLGGFLGGLATLLSVTITIRHAEIERLQQEKTEKRVYIDFMLINGFSIDKIKQVEPHKAKTVYLFDEEVGPCDASTCCTFQIINPSNIPIRNLRLKCICQGSETEHTYNARIPCLYPDDLTYVILPKRTWTTTNVIGWLAEPHKAKPDETVKELVIEYYTEANEEIGMQITDFKTITFKSSNEQLLHYSVSSSGKWIMPKDWYEILGQSENKTDI